MTATVVMGFLHILNVCLLPVFVMVRSRKFILLLTSDYIACYVNFGLNFLLRQLDI